MRIENEVRFLIPTDTVEVTITRKNGDEHIALFDLGLWPLLKHYHWYVHETRHRSGKFYLATTINNCPVFAHRIVMDRYLSDQFPEVDYTKISNT